MGADVYEMYAVADAIAHEYEFGDGEHMASSRTQLDWFLYQAGMLTFRAFAEGKATWILNYSWDGDKNVDAREAMKNLASSQVMVGANFWDAPGHSMAGSMILLRGRKFLRGSRSTKKRFTCRGNRCIRWESISHPRAEITIRMLFFRPIGGRWFCSYASIVNSRSLRHGHCAIFMVECWSCRRSAS